jgi:UDP-2,3-diacylglucosamine hydrolase
MEITAAPHWQTVDFISDLHLQASEPQTLAALEHYLAHTQAQALFVLGDLFEVWVGDDALQSPNGIETQVAQLLHQASERLDVFIMCGNRDFLMGEQLLAACGARALPDPSVLHLGATCWLLAHGDAQCLADAPYQAFRAQVRSAAWQQDFLSQPLDKRQALARQMRLQSEAQKKQLAQAQSPWIDLDREACVKLLETHAADHMIHGHTHQAAQHDLGQGRMRWVLSDWDLHATPPRAQVLRLHSAGGAPQRLTLAAAQAAR